MRGSAQGIDPPDGRRGIEAAALAHFSTVLAFVFPLGNVAGPVAVLLTAGRSSARAAWHAKAAAIWQTAATAAAWLILAAGPLHGVDPDVRLLVITAAVAASAAAGFSVLIAGAAGAFNPRDSGPATGD